MATEEETTVPMYEARDSRMVSVGNGTQAVRIARFLKPCAETVNEAVKVPDIPLLSEIFGNNQEWPSKVVFKGCRNSTCRTFQEKWEKWMDGLAGKCGVIWNQSNICDAILSSRYEFRFNPALLLGLAEFWCPETNTFVFPWGEATVTLEDVMINGGFSPIGDPIRSPVTGEFMEIQKVLQQKRVEMYKCKQKKASYSAWMQHFMEGKNEFEHAAFLSLWLSRYVFPSLPFDIVRKEVLPIAAHLSNGKKLALGPAVLASIYHNLRLLKEQAAASVDSITVTGPMQLVQMWAFEHFPLLGPESPNPLKPGEPRAARWHRLNSKISLPLVRSVVKLAKNFVWRPYADDLNNWNHPPYYKEKEVVLFNHLNSDEELQSFVRCMLGSELEGMDCEEMYMPHRVSMLFGMDQDLPGDLSVQDSAVERNISAFIAPKSFVPGVSVRYFNWWQQTKMAREVAVKETLKREKCSNNNTKLSSLPLQARLEGQRCDALGALTGTKVETGKNVPVFIPERSSNARVSQAGMNKNGSLKKRNCSETIRRRLDLESKGEESHASSCPDLPSIDQDLSGDDDIVPLSLRMRTYSAAKRTRNPEREEGPPTSSCLDFLSKTKMSLEQDLSDDDVPLSARMKTYSAAERTIDPERVEGPLHFLSGTNMNSDEDPSDDDVPLSQRIKSYPAAKTTRIPEAHSRRKSEKFTTPGVTIESKTTTRGRKHCNIAAPQKAKETETKADAGDSDNPVLITDDDSGESIWD